MVRHGDRDEALRAYEAFDQILPNHPSSPPGAPTSRPANRSNRWSRMPGKARLRCSMALAPPANQQGDETRGHDLSEASRSISPRKTALAIITLGDIYERLKQNEQAIDVYETVRENDPLRTTADIQTSPDSRSVWAAGRRRQNSQADRRRKPKERGRLIRAWAICTAHTSTMPRRSKPIRVPWPRRASPKKPIGQFIISGGFPMSARRKWPEAEATSCRRSLFIQTSPWS